MDPFPEEWEFVSLFETDPHILDPDLPWRYNTLTFDTTRGADRILCTIQPGYEQLDFSWWHAEIRHLHLELRWVCSLTVTSDADAEYLLAEFRDSHLRTLRIQLRPTIHCEWGTTNELP